MPHKLCGWYARRKHVHMKHEVGRCDHEDLHGHPKNHINQGRFRLRQNEAERQRGFLEEPLHHHCLRTHVCVCASQPSPTLSLSLPRLSLSLSLSLSLLKRTFWVIKGKEKKQIIFLYINVVVFICYTIII